MSETMGHDISKNLARSIALKGGLLNSSGLTLESVVKFDAMFRNIWNIPVMEKVIKGRFGGKYPARKSIQTEFAHAGGESSLFSKLDAIAYNGAKIE